MTTHEEVEILEEPGPISTEQPVANDRSEESLGRGPNNGTSFRKVLRALRRLDERAAILDLLGDQAVKLFYGNAGRAGASNSTYLIERRDGSRSSADFDIVLELSIELHRMAIAAREEAGGILAATVDVASVPEGEDPATGDSMGSGVESPDKEPTAVVRFDAGLSTSARLPHSS
jgi:hypothetical protein